jgi:hypothetical protein
MLDDKDPSRRCDDGSHRILNVTWPYPEAQVIHARLVSALGAGRVSPLRRVDEGWEIIICRRCVRRDQGGRLAA